MPGATNVIKMVLDEKVIQPLRKIRQSLGQKMNTSGLKSTNKQLRSMGQGFTMLNSRLAVFRIGLTGLSAYMSGQFIRDVIRVRSEFELLELRIKTIAGPGQAKQAREWLDAFAGRNAQNTLQTYTDLFARLKGSGVDPMNGSLQDLVDISTAFGLTMSDTTLLIRGITDMFGKGTAQAEEFKKQIGQRVPGALKLVAKELGFTMKEFMKEAAQGNIMAEDFFSAFRKVAKEQYGGISEDFQNSWTSTFGRLNLEWTKFLDNIGKSPFMNELKGLIDDLGSLLREYNTLVGSASGPAGINTQSRLTELLREGGISRADDPEAVKAQALVRLSREYSAELRKQLQLQADLEAASGPFWEGLTAEIKDFFGDPKALEAYNKANSSFKNIEETVRNMTNQMLAAVDATQATKDAMVQIDGLSISGEKGGFLQGVISVLDEFDVKIKDTFDAGEEMAKTFSTSMATTFNTFFIDVIEGRLKSFEDYLLSFFKNIANSLSQMLSEMVTKQIVSGIAGSIGGGFSGKTAQQKAFGQQKGVRVEVINQSGQPVEGQAKTTFDANGMVTSIVIDAIKRNKGGMRSAIQGVR